MNATETEMKQFRDELSKMTCEELRSRYKFIQDETQNLLDAKVDAGLVGKEFIAESVEEHLWRQDILQATLEERERAQKAQCSLEPKFTGEPGEILIDPREIEDAYYRAEVGDAELLQKLFVNKIIYDHSEKQWYHWNQKYWEEDKKESVRLLVPNQLSAQYNFLRMKKKREGASDDSSVIKGLSARINALRFKSKINNIMFLAQSMQSLGIIGDEWDRHPDLLGVRNGVLDLTTGELGASNPSDYVRTVSSCEWKGLNEPCPRWEKFLAEIFDNNMELICFIQRLLGYGITGHSSEHIFVVFWGEGRNGKDTLLETLASVLGDSLATPVQPQVLLADNKNDASATPHLAAMRSRRLCWVSETNDGAMLNVGQVKYLTGGGTVVARPLYGEPTTFSPQYLLVLMTNHCPKISADDFAIWQRVLLVPFTQAFVDKPIQANEHKRDPKLKEELKKELSGILAWLVRGCLEWQSNGLQVPDIVRAATSQYQDGEDVISRFIEERCSLDADAKIKSSDLYNAYKNWAKSNQADESNVTAFGKKVCRRFKRIKEKAGIFYCGLHLVSKPEEIEDDETIPFGNGLVDFNQE